MDWRPVQGPSLSPSNLMDVVVCCPVIVQSVRWGHLAGSLPGFPALQTDVHTVQQQTEGSALATTVGYRL